MNKLKWAMIGAVMPVCLLFCASGYGQETADGAAPEQVIVPEDVPEEMGSIAEADELTFNFRGVPLDAVLEYFSRAGGFIIATI